MPVDLSQATDEELDAMLQETLGSISGQAPESAPAPLGAELAAPETPSNLATDTEDATAVIGEILAEGVSTPGDVIAQLRDRGFEIVKSGGAAIPEAPTQLSPEAPLKDLRSQAAEQALGGTF